MNYAQLLTAIDEFDLASYLIDKGFESSGTKKGDEYIGDCPGCGKRKCCVDVSKRGFHCFVCQSYEDSWDIRSHCMVRRPIVGAGGVISLVKWLDGLGTRDAIEFIAEHSIYGTDIRELPDLRVIEEVLEAGSAATIDPPEGWAPLPGLLPYMVKRGITLRDSHTFGLFWCPEGRYGNRIVFPVWDRERMIYWQARAMYEAEEAPKGRKFIKCLNPEKAPGAAVSSEVLMNLDIAALHPRVAIVEGPMDCVRTGPDAVCTFGKAMSPAQVRRLIQAGVRAVDLMYDGPKSKEPMGAWPEMFQLSPWLSMFFDVRLVFLPHGDPADWSREQLWDFRSKSTSAGRFSRLASLD